MNEWLDDLKTAIAFLTRLPVPQADGARPANFARAGRLFPVVGAGIGAVIGLVCLILRSANVPELAAATLALGCGVLLTGALHEDGLADVADGFGGGNDTATKLAIMRDSRIGTYGVLILLVGFTTKVCTLAVLPDGVIVPGVVAAHALARAVLPAVAMNLPYARSDGLAAGAGRPDLSIVVTAAAIAVLLALLLLPFVAALYSTLAAVVGAAGMALLARRQIGGQTGDVLGATEQVAETFILVLLAARFS